MKTTKKLFCLSILALVIACGKEATADNQKVNASNLSITTKPLSVIAEVVEKEAAFKGRAGHTSLVYKKRMWLLAGLLLGDDPSDVWQSEDGVQWKLANPKAAFPPRAEHAATVHNDLMWLVGGRNGMLNINDTLYNDVWYSEDGKGWQSTIKNAPFSPRSSHTLSTFKGRMWLIGGQNTLQGNDLNSDVWVSGDGENWVLATADAPFGQRTNHTAIVHDNKLWIMGGYGTGHDSLDLDFRNDVWYTADGQNWVEASPNAAFEPRSGHTAVSYNEHMWLVGGYAGNAEYLNDIWRSTDGITWKKGSVNPNFKTRSDHTSVVFRDQFWTMAGYPIIAYPTKTGIYTEGFHSDVWSFK